MGSGLLELGSLPLEPPSVPRPPRRSVSSTVGTGCFGIDSWTENDADASRDAREFDVTGARDDEPVDREDRPSYSPASYSSYREESSLNDAAPPP